MRRQVIYTRYSTELQNPKSCADQEREVRQVLTEMGIDTTTALVIHEEAQSGTREDRDGYQRIVQMMEAGEISILAVDDQSRLSRGGNASSAIQDLVYHGSRFISTGERIDTNDPGWKLSVKVLELHNSVCIDDVARRAHRGQRGRASADLSAGDICFGYESYVDDPNWDPTVAGRPRPPRKIRIKRAHRKWVRKIFFWFAQRGWSISKIARELTNRGVVRDAHRRGTKWHHYEVRRMLGNPKYIGVWRWGLSHTIRDSRGKKKQVAVPEKQWVVRDRPYLRIIDQDTWELTQEKLARLQDVYGKKEGQRRRGPRVHHTAIYPQSILGGLLVCGMCGQRLWRRSSDSYEYYGCPAHKDGACTMRTWVRIDKAEEALLGFVRQLLLSWPPGFDRVVAVVRERFEAAARRVPQQRIADESRLKKLKHQLNHLIAFVARGDESPAVRAQLSGVEREIAILEGRIAEAERMHNTPVTAPNDEWAQAELTQLVVLLRSEPARSAPLLRRLLGTVYVHQVMPPGKTRGYPRLTFRIDGWALVMQMLEGRIPASIAAALVAQPDGDDTAEFSIELGAPTKMDEWGPRLAEMRASGMPWKQIWELTGLGSGPAYVAWKRYIDAQQGQTNASEDAA